MDLLKFLSVLFVYFVNSHAGGHGEKHHDHVKLHVPEFIHHDHHTKVITIHHHHHKPKKEHHHHHHHHHHPKPHIPHGHHGYHHHHKKTSTHSVSKGHSSHHGSHGHHGHKGHHGHHGHHGHGHHGHEHKHHDIPSYDPPSISYEPPAVNYNPPVVNYEPPQGNYPSTNFVQDYTPFVPSVSGNPQVRGVVHTVKQVKVFDSLPGALQGNAGKPVSHGYEVTEEGDEGEEDVFTAVNSLPQSFPGTYGFVKNAAPANNDPFADISQQSTASVPNHDPFAAAPQPTSFGNIEGFTGQNGALGTSVPTQGVIFSSVQPSQFTGNEASETGFDDIGNTIIGDVSSTAFLSPEEGFNDDTPVSFNREAGIQQTIKTGGIETVVY